MPRRRLNCTDPAWVPVTATEAVAAWPCTMLAVGKRDRGGRRDERDAHLLGGGGGGGVVLSPRLVGREDAGACVVEADCCP